jgi:hypothetical protein
MSNALTYEKLVTKLEDIRKDIILVSTKYNFDKQKGINQTLRIIKVKGRECKHTWKTKVASIIYHNSGCHECNGYKRITYDYLVKRIKNETKAELLTTEKEFNEQTVKASKRKIDIIDECGHKRNVAVTNYLNTKNKCPECNNLSKTKPFEHYVNPVIENRKDLIIVSTKEDFDKQTIKPYERKIFVKGECDHIWDARPDSLALRNTGCAICKERNIGKNESRSFTPFLEHISPFSFETQYKVSYEDTCYYVDFYIPELNVCIEYDEKHHYTEDNMLKDAKRQEYIENKLGCSFIRVDDDKFMDNNNYAKKLFTDIFGSSILNENIEDLFE